MSVFWRRILTIFVSCAQRGPFPSRKERKVLFLERHLYRWLHDFC
jgi:hypothetical protein